MRFRLETAARKLTGGALDIAELPWQDLRYQHMARLQRALRDQGRPATTVNNIMAAVRGVLKACRRLGLISADDYASATDFKALKVHRLPAGRAVSRGEMGLLFAACARDTSPATAVRDTALLALLVTSGLRRSEVASLALEDINLSTGEIRVLAGKGNKQRLAFASHEAVGCVKVWLGARGAHPGKLFCPVNKGGVVDASSGITGQAVRNMCAKRAEEAGIGSFSPHDLRRTFISEILDAGGDLVTAQQLAGHASVTTTARYDRRGNATKERTVNLIKLEGLVGNASARE